ncbi:Flavoprotein, partial [Leifsonia aquatica ATCC 14665]
MTIVVGVTGGIAAYKAVGVIRALVLDGHSVHVVATEAALRFVGRPTLEAISRNPVATDLYEGVAEVRHVALGQSADLIVIAPATANTIAKLAAGIADDLLGNTVLASTAPLVIAPAMHTEMWRNAATVANIATLRGRGIHIVGPASGQLTGADSGPGRMEEPEVIARVALRAAGVSPRPA